MTFKGIWDSIFHGETKIGRKEALEELAQVMNISGYPTCGTFDVMTLVSDEIKGTYRRYAECLILTDALVSWLDTEGWVYKEDFLSIPEKFTQSSSVIESSRGAYNLKLTANHMFVIMNQPGFVNTYESLATEKLKNATIISGKPKIRIILLFWDTMQMGKKLNTWVSWQKIMYFRRIRVCNCNCNCNLLG